MFRVIWQGELQQEAAGFEGLSSFFLVVVGLPEGPLLYSDAGVFALGKIWQKNAVMILSVCLPERTSLDVVTLETKSLRL